MAARKIKNQPLSLVGTPIAIYYDSDYNEYQVRVKGHPNATYFTDNRADAISSAQVMRNTLLEEFSKPAKRKKNPDIHVDIDSHNLKKNPVKSHKVAEKDYFRGMYDVQEKRGNKWVTFAILDKFENAVDSSKYHTKKYNVITRVMKRD